VHKCLHKCKCNKNKIYYFLVLPQCETTYQHFLGDMITQDLHFFLFLVCGYQIVGLDSRGCDRDSERMRSSKGTARNEENKGNTLTLTAEEVEHFRNELLLKNIV
jgi:hypothetical protein